VGEADPLVIGVGNAYGRDDAAGLSAARRLCEEAGAPAVLREVSGEGTALIDAWAGAGTVVLIDAVSSGAPPGTIVCVDARAASVPAGWFRYSTHAFGVAEAIELARVLGRLPARLIVVGIEGARFDAGVGLSPEVARAVEEVARRGLGAIATEGAARSGGTEAAAGDRLRPGDTTTG